MEKDTFFVVLLVVFVTIAVCVVGIRFMGMSCALDFFIAVREFILTICAALITIAILDGNKGV